MEIWRIECPFCHGNYTIDAEITVWNPKNVKVVMGWKLCLK